MSNIVEGKEFTKDGRRYQKCTVYIDGRAHNVVKEIPTEEEARVVERFMVEDRGRKLGVFQSVKGQYPSKMRSVHNQIRIKQLAAERKGVR